jgi:hypothetical protein
MSTHPLEHLMDQKLNLLLLSAIISASSASPHEPLDGPGPSSEGFSSRQRPIKTESESYSQGRHSKSESTPSSWAQNPPAAGLDRSLCQHSFAQYLNVQHTPPPAYLRSEASSDFIEDEEGDDEQWPRPVDPNYQPVPTKWLMLGYTRVADIPTSTPIQTMTRRCREHDSSKAPAAIPSDSSARCTTELRAVDPSSQRDWNQDLRSHVLGALSIFLIIVFIVEICKHICRACCWRRSNIEERGRLALEGDEKQLRAFSEATRSTAQFASTDLTSYV